MRLTMWYSAVLGALVIAIALGSFVVIRNVLSRRADRFLQDVAVTFSEEVRKEVTAGGNADAVIRDELVDYRFQEIDFFVFDGDRLVGRTTRPDPRVEMREADVAVDVGALARALRRRPAPSILSVNDAEGGFRVASAPLDLASGVFTVAAAQSWHGYAETLELIGIGYALIVALLLLLSAIGGYWLTSHSLASVAAMSRKAASIGRGNLGDRLVASNPNDELGELASVFNDMLARLERSFAQQQQFMQDASHELRSPVAAIRMEADVTLRNAHRSEAEYRDALGTVRQSAIRLSRVVDDLFLLVRHDAEQRPTDPVLVDLGEVVHEAVRGVRAVAIAKAIRIDVPEAPEAPVRGDAGDLQRIVVNLVENALKNAPAGSTVSVTVASEGDAHISVRVQDAGPGIPAGDRGRIFDRFFRGAEQEAGTYDGAGLGLPIARTLAELHAGTLELESSGPSGSTFALVVPRAVPT